MSDALHWSRWCQLTALLLTLSTTAYSDQVKIVSDDREASEIRADMIQQARSELFVSYFVFRDDATSIAGFALLLDAADRGVRVKIMLDGLYRDIASPYLKALVSHPNIEVRDYNRFSIFSILRAFRRSHEKIIIADNVHSDGYHYITGGRNISNKYFGYGTKRNFHDIDVYVHGESALVARNEFFLKQWESEWVQEVPLGNYSPESLEQKTCPQAKRELDQCNMDLAARKRTYANVLLRIADQKRNIQSGKFHGVNWNSDTQWHRVASEVGETRFMFDPPGVKKSADGISADIFNTLVHDPEIRELMIISPYVILAKRGKDLISRLTERGVAITILTNSLNSTDNILAQAGYANNKRWLLEQGVVIHHYTGPDTIHGKTLIVDQGRRIMIGSYNFDPRSASLNREIGTSFNATRDVTHTAVQDARSMWEDFLSRSNLIGADGIPVGHDQEHPNAPGWKVFIMQLLRPIVAIPIVRNNL